LTALTLASCDVTIQSETIRCADIILCYDAKLAFCGNGDILIFWSCDLDFDLLPSK